jgi:pyruvate,water dikinase
MAFDSSRWVSWFDEIGRQDVAAAGGKGASLSDMARAGLPVPPGFIVCTEAFRQFLVESQLDSQIASLLEYIDVTSQAELERVSQLITNKIDSQELSPTVRAVIRQAYEQLSQGSGREVEVAVRSSAAAEDSANASFAGQQETYLNVFGAECLLSQVRACWCSFFKPRALFYRCQKGCLSDQSIAVVVQRMVNPQKSGVMFTVDPVQRRRDRIMIEAAWGLGESVVSGMVTPDNYVVDKDSGLLVKKFVAFKRIMIVRSDACVGVQEIQLEPAMAKAQVLTEQEITQLTQTGILIEAHFGLPQDVEWAIEDERLYILQSRPVTTL